jgi:hypothetical protein
LFLSDSLCWLLSLGLIFFKFLSESWLIRATSQILILSSTYSKDPELGDDAPLTNVGQYIPVHQELYPKDFDSSLTVHTVSLVWEAKPHFHAKQDSSPGTAKFLFISWLIK